MPERYRNIGVASTFSPRFMAVLAEADRIARKIGAPLRVVHAAEEETDRRERFREALARFERENDTPVLWASAPSPTDAILDLCKEHAVDLLMAGALERESDHRYFLGGVARELLRRAECELLLFPKPGELEVPCEIVAVSVDVTDPSVEVLDRACRWATRLGAREMIFLSVFTPFDEAIASARGEKSATPEDVLATIVDNASGFDGEVDIRVVRSNTGFAVCDFVQNSGANFLVVGTLLGEGGRVLPPHMDWLHQVIPTNVLLLNRPAPAR